MSFGFKSIGHFIAIAARDIVKFGTTAAPAVEAAVETVSAIVMPSSVAVERAAFAALGHITQAAQDINVTGTGADSTVSLTIPMLASEVNDFKEILAAFMALKNKQNIPVGK